MTGKRVKASYDWSGKWREISQQITRPSKLKKKITISKKNRVAGCQWRENGCEQAMIGRENGARFLSKSQGPSTLKKNTISKKNRVAAANGGKTAVSKILNYYYY